VNTAGVPWTNVQALRRRGIDAQLVVFNRYTLHPEADRSLDLEGGLVRRQLAQWRALASLLPRTDLFHFTFGLTLVPQSLQFPILRAFGKRSVMHYLGSDIRGKEPRELAYGKKAGAEIVGSYDAIRWVPEATVIPPGIDLSAVTPSAPSGRRRPVVVHAAPTQDRPRLRACESRRRTPDRGGPPPRRGARPVSRRRHRRRPAERGLVRALRDRVHGAGRS
jgi:hypothetical protein